MSGSISGPLVTALVVQLDNAGSIPTVGIFITRLGVVNLMEKWLFHAQTKPATRRQMLTPGERLNPP